ncbi:hypothetical protein HMPREF1979_00467 [Actinomyces johnsonii F0542]|uniref:Uncharacterized protein n=1 Tax=Actinomyces johnsonii F0542 TaxID=1321818 RepID=U1QCK0_9ACTO|nr:hypothetical protein HMPREF1979_00467 [Actinomyces johnsonii F0542]
MPFPKKTINTGRLLRIQPSPWSGRQILCGRRRIVDLYPMV